MTKEEIIELQEKTARVRRMFWQLLEKGQFPSPEHAKAIFTCYFALDKVTDLVKQYISQLPLEEPKPRDTLIPADLPPLVRSFDTPLTDSLWPKEPEPKPRKKGVKP